jgi:hypothetical protein
LGRTMNRPFILPCWVFVPRDCGRECVSLSWFKALHNQEHAIHVRRADQHAERRGAQAARGSDPTRSAVRFNERARLPAPGVRLPVCRATFRHLHHDKKATEPID